MKIEIAIQGRWTTRAATTRSRAFTLLEVMIAIAILFVGTFAILSLVSSSLANARRLQRPMVDASAVLATFAATNSLVEGHFHGSLGEPELLGKDYQNYIYDGDIVEIASNHLYSVECKIEPANNPHEVISDLTTILYAPRSPPGTLDGGIGIPGR